MDLLLGWQEINSDFVALHSVLDNHMFGQYKILWYNLKNFKFSTANVHFWGAFKSNSYDYDVFITK